MGDAYQVKDMSVPAIENAEHVDPATTGDSVAAKKVVNYETLDGVTWVRAGTPGTERYDYSSSATIYTAIAALGTDESSTGWTITKYDLTDSSDASATVANDVSWADRATGTYL